MKIICKDMLTPPSVIIPGSYQKVGILLNRDMALISAIYNCIKKRITCVPLDPLWPDDRIHAIIKNTKVDAVLTTTEHAHRVDPVKAIVVEGSAVVDFAQRNGNNEIGYIQHTSGSTGIPKGVEIPRRGLFHYADCISELIDFSPDRRIACLSAASFDIFYLESVIALDRGLTVVLGDEEEQRNPRRMAKLIAEGFVDIIQMTPAKMQMLQNYDTNLVCLENVKEILIGGEPFPLSLLHVLQEKTTAQIYNMYGPTEATGWTTVSNLTHKDRIDIGRPIRGTTVYIVNEQLSPLLEGEMGEICIAGPCVARRYTRQADLTAEKFVVLPQRPHPVVYRTGDLGRYLSSGDLEYIGRMDNQIKIRGYRVEPEEIEAHLEQMDGIRQAVVAAVKANETDKVLTAFYTGEKHLREQDMIEHLSLRLPSYMVPAVFRQVESFILSENGKIDRKRVLECREMQYDAVMQGADLDKITPRQKEILEVIRIQLNTKNSGELCLDTKFSGIGVDSISFIRLVLALEDAFDMEFDDELLLTEAFPTVASIMEYVDQKAASV